MQGISRLAEDLLTSQDRLCSMEKISQLIIVSELTKHIVSSKNTGHACFTNRFWCYGEEKKLHEIHGDVQKTNSGYFGSLCSYLCVSWHKITWHTWQKQDKYFLSVQHRKYCSRFSPRYCTLFFHDAHFGKVAVRNMFCFSGYISWVHWQWDHLPS